MTFDVWTLFGSTLPVEVSDKGEIDHKAELVFHGGHCHSLALALHMITGWPLFGLKGDPNDPKDIEHVLIESPKGFLDVNGLNFEAPYDKQCIVPMKAEDVESETWQSNMGYLTPEPEKALPFAINLLNRYLPDEAKKFQVDRELIGLPQEMTA
jgi:hypothetical protein